MTFFVDRSLGRKKVPDALRKAGADIEVHDDHFPQNASDRVWLSEAGRRNWVVITADARIRYRTLERDALLAARVQAFVLTSRLGPDAGEILAAALPRMRALLERHQGRPFIAKVSRGPDVRILFTE